MSAENESLDERLLESLPLEAVPPADLERRVLAELSRRGLIRVGAPARRHLALAAALALTFALGLVAGARFLARPALGRDAPSAQRFLLLLYEPRPLDRAGVDLVAEYAAWAGELRRRGQLVVAEKLRSDALRLGGANDGAQAGGAGPTGFFLIRARNLEEAMAIARRCPHLAHGGEIALRPVDPT